MDSDVMCSLKNIRSSVLNFLVWVLKFKKIRKLVIAAILETDADDMYFNGELALIKLAGQNGIKNFIDVGANEGAWTKQVLNNVKSISSISMYEPNENYVSTLETLVQKTERVTFHPFAISERDEIVRFNKNGVFSSIDDSGSDEVTSVNWTFLKECHNINQKNLIKIDTEGFDLDVLKQFNQAGLLRDSWVQVEYGEAQFKRGITISDYISVVPNHRPFVVSNRKLFSTKIMELYDFCQPLLNIVFIPETDCEVIDIKNVYIRRV